MENAASQPSCMSAGEGSWAMHFAGFMEMDRRGGGGVSDSGFFSSFVPSDMVCNDDEDDDSLQDTACSSAARSKVTRMNGMCMKSMVTMDPKEMSTPQLAKYCVDESSQQQTAGAVRGVITGGNNNERQLHECNDLRKRGLCLVPLSMLIHYLG